MLAKVENADRQEWHIFRYGDLCKYFTEHYNDVSTTHSRLRLMIQIADAIDYLHGNLNTVHRDIKPANILVTEGTRMNQVILVFLTP